MKRYLKLSLLKYLADRLSKLWSKSSLYGVVAQPECPTTLLCERERVAVVFRRCHPTSSTFISFTDIEYLALGVRGPMDEGNRQQGEGGLFGRLVLLSRGVNGFGSTWQQGTVNTRY